MAQTEFNLVDVVESGQEVYEAYCPHDNTIRPRAIKKVVKKPVIVQKDKDLIASSSIDVRKQLKAKEED